LSASTSHSLPVCCLSRESGGHRDLHSFPTRRSSDLLDLLALESVQALFLGVEHARRAGEAQAFLAGDLGDRALRGEVAVEDAEVDRKSTRLNSSHVKISYAVFCLKKKTS